MNSKGELRTAAFMEMPAKSRGSDIVFLSENLCDELVTEITKLANTLLKQTVKKSSKYVSISEIYGVLWINKNIDMNETSEVIERDEPNKRRKKGENISARHLDRFGKEVYEFVSTKICAPAESPTVYINAAARESAFRSTGAMKSIRRNIFDNDDDDDSAKDLLIRDHHAVRLNLSKFPNKNVTFKLHEVQLVISLFDAIAVARNDVEGEDYRANNLVTATHTKQILIKHARYSELVAETIVRWIVGRKVVKKMSGRKIDVEFEADIWGNLMICEFEQKNVSCIEYDVCVN
jgi:hypothetical protein